MGFRDIVESDAVSAVELIKTHQFTFSHVTPLILDCRNLLSRSWTVDLHSVFREANKPADCIAKNAMFQSDVFKCMWFCPMFAVNLLNNDIVGRVTPRCVALSNVS